MKSRSTSAATAIAKGGLCLLGVTIAFAQTQQGSKPPMAEEAFKDIQILKGIPVDEFMDTMGMFSAATGLNCVDCHASDNTVSWKKFADETPRKQIARRMLRMMSAINKDNFGGAHIVTCFTCHRGSDRTEPVPNLAIQYSAPQVDPNEIQSFSASGKPSVDQVFDKYIQAIGGAERVAKLTSFAGHGTYEGYDTEHLKVPLEIWAKAPAQRATVVHMGIGDSVRIYDGHASWIASPDRPLPLMVLTGGNLEGAKIDAMVSFPIQLRQAFSRWRVGSTTIDDREIQVLQGSNPKQPPLNLYFDEAGLLMRLVRFVDTAVGRVPTQIDFADYREVSGVKVPFRWITTWTDGQATNQLNDVQPNVEIDAVKFSEPAPAPPPKTQ
jgi:photosynthetic reaction center cytochrome c subunit